MIQLTIGHDIRKYKPYLKMKNKDKIFIMSLEPINVLNDDAETYIIDDKAIKEMVRFLNANIKED